MGSRWRAVVVDAVDPERLGRWWAEVLHLHLLREASGEVVVGRDGSPSLVFTRASGGHVDHGRLQIELDPEDRDAELERLLDMGARRVAEAGDGMTLADPEGNEFVMRGAAARPPGGAARLP